MFKRSYLIAVAMMAPGVLLANAVAPGRLGLLRQANTDPPDRKKHEKDPRGR
jgi:hypothetical protein